MLNESKALGRTVSESLSRTLFENERLGLKVDDTLSDISVDADTLRLTKNVALDGKLLDDTSLCIRGNAALKSGSIDDDKDPVFQSDWLSKNSEDDISWLTEYELLESILSEEGTLKVKDRDCL